MPITGHHTHLLDVKNGYAYTALHTAFATYNLIPREGNPMPTTPTYAFPYRPRRSGRRALRYSRARQPRQLILVVTTAGVPVGIVDVKVT
jgi:hypothetical protein